jgi:hypothetical protein
LTLGAPGSVFGITRVALVVTTESAFCDCRWDSGKGSTLIPAAVIRRYAPSLITSIGICREYGGGFARDERAVVGRGPACGQDLASGPAGGNAQGKPGRLGRVGDPGCDLFRRYHLAGTRAAGGAQVGVGSPGNV